MEGRVAARERAPGRVVVIGLGRFGTSAVRTLHELGYEVIGVDLAERAVADAAPHATLLPQGSRSQPGPSSWTRLTRN